MKQKMIYIPVFIAAMTVIFVTGIPLRASESDDATEALFNKTYVYSTYLKDDAVSAKAANGVVTLTGTVSEESHKSLAYQTAANLPGVERVDNKLVTTAEAAAENEDMWIGRKVKMALLFHRNVDAGRTDIKVKDGIVTLKGESSSMAQKELTAEYAGDIEGVKQVKNKMTVGANQEMSERTKAEKIDDASVTAQVKTALLTHLSTSSVDTKVVTRDGEVMLTGIAGNAAEKALVSKLIADIQGVTSVKNDMTIKQIMTR